MQSCCKMKGQLFEQNKSDTVVYLDSTGDNIEHVSAIELDKNAAPSAAATSSSGSGSTHSGMMADDDLEYHITFPAAGPAPDPDQDGFLYVGNERKEPVVVLLGWYACQDRHLAKYSKIYEEMGCITIRFIPRPDIILYQPDNMRAIAAKLLEVVTDFNLEAHPVLMHMFSNGGCYVYRHLCELLAADSGTTLRIRGCIFDSGPAVSTPLNLYRAILATTRGPLLYRWLRSLALMIIIIFAVVLEFLLSFAWSERRRIASQAMWTCLAKDPLRVPQLFLYSRADNICSHKSIKSFAEERRKCGVAVVEMCWEDSPHVKHFIVHREEYIERIAAFSDMCLGDDCNEPAAAIIAESAVVIDCIKGQ